MSGTRILFIFTDTSGKGRAFLGLAFRKTVWMGGVFVHFEIGNHVRQSHRYGKIACMSQRRIDVICPSVLNSNSSSFLLL